MTRVNGFQAMNWQLLIPAFCLMLFGVVMVTSASISAAELRLDDALFYGKRQFGFVLIGIVLALLVLNVPTSLFEKMSFNFLLLALLLLVLVFIPGLGVGYYGAKRWIKIGAFTAQPSEFARIALMIYLASYMVRRGDEVRTSLKGFVKPWLIIAIMSALLLLEPDFSAAVVLCATCLGLLFMAGARFYLFVLGILSVSLMAAVLIMAKSYRQSRLAFLNPWEDPYGATYQLTQSLIAIGSGGFNGLGLGSSVQKLFYLPEAHNDFLFAILAEELGFIGVLLLLFLYAALIYQIIKIAGNALYVNHLFGAYLCFAIAIWLSAQVFINIGVSMGILPTTGLTLPLMSSGGSAILVTCVALAMVQRVHSEVNMRNISFNSASPKEQSK